MKLVLKLVVKFAKTKYRSNYSSPQFDLRYLDIKYTIYKFLIIFYNIVILQELEDTIESMKSQVNSLQQKTLVLQEDLDLRNQYPQFSSNSPIKAL